jgi:hypothetical protein
MKIIEIQDQVFNLMQTLIHMDKHIFTPKDRIVIQNTIQNLNDLDSMMDDFLSDEEGEE